MTSRFAALFTLPVTLLLTTPAFAQDLENDSPVAAPENAPPPATDLNDAVDQLSKERTPAPRNSPPPPMPMENPAKLDQRHESAKPFAKAQHKAAKHKPVKVAKKPAKTKKGGKAAPTKNQTSKKKKKRP